MLDNPGVRLANNWLHDIGTGLWAACLLVVWVLEGQIAQVASVPDAATALTQTQQLIFWLLIGALVDITITGVVRLFYWRSATPAEELASKRPALIGKHVAFLVVYGGGTLWAWSMLG